jgi:hypothetical protein
VKLIGGRQNPDTSKWARPLSSFLLQQCAPAWVKLSALAPLNAKVERSSPPIVELRYGLSCQRPEFSLFSSTVISHHSLAEPAHIRERGSKASVILGGRVEQRMGSPPPEKSQYELLRDKRVAEVEKKFGPVLAARKEL